MKKYKILSYIFTALALILSHLMCITIAYDYASMLWCGRYGLNSAPASVVFLLIIPYGIAILICALVAYLLHRKAKQG